jgi:hypothetical protein
MPATQNANSGTDEYVSPRRAAEHLPIGTSTVIRLFDAKLIDGFVVPRPKPSSYKHRRISLKGLRRFADRWGMPYYE